MTDGCTVPGVHGASGAGATTPLLVARWEAWDDQPGSTYRTVGYEASCALLGADLGLSVTEVRARLAELRRAGLSRADAVGELVFVGATVGENEAAPACVNTRGPADSPTGGHRHG